MILVISPFLDDRAGACKHDRVRRGYVPMTVNRDRARSNLCGSRVSEYSCHLLVTRVQNGFLLFERYRPISRLDFRSRGQLSSVSAMTLSMSSLPPFLPNSSSLHHWPIDLIKNRSNRMKLLKKRDERKKKITRCEIITIFTASYLSIFHTSCDHVSIKFSLLWIVLFYS